jgi:hypothetical protein
MSYVVRVLAKTLPNLTQAFRSLPQSLHAIAATVSRLGYGSILLNPLQFIIHHQLIFRCYRFSEPECVIKYEAKLGKAIPVTGREGP